MSNDKDPANLPDDVLSQLGALAGLGLRWGFAMANELQELPATLARLRRGTEHFETTTRQMAASAAQLEQILELYSRILGEAADRNAEMTRLVQRQMESLAGATNPEAVKETLGEVGRAVESIARLTPFWPLVAERDDVIDVDDD